MKKEQVNIILKGFGKLPKYATPDSAGADIYAANVVDILIKPMERKLIPTGVFLELNPDSEVQIRPRSGLALKHGITVLNAPGTIDSDYQGEIGIVLINLSNESFLVERGDRIAQAVLVTGNGLRQAKWNVVEEFSRETERGNGGFGHTGTKEVI